MAVGDLDEAYVDRRDLYAEGAAVLDEDEYVAGAEALFDQALGNGLLAVVSAQWPGLALAWRARTPWASELLSTLVERLGVVDGVVQLPTVGPHAETDDSGVLWVVQREELVAVRVDQLRDAVRRTQQARHGRGPGGQVNRDDVSALVALDTHPALQALAGRYVDEDWRRDQVADRNELARAADYLGLLDDDEVARRAEAAADALAPTPGDVEPEPQECPVCERDGLTSSGGDHFGYGVAAGTCLVCSYRRSSGVAYQLGVDLEWDRRWADD